MKTLIILTGLLIYTLSSQTQMVWIYEDCYVELSPHTEIFLMLDSTDRERKLYYLEYCK